MALPVSPAFTINFTSSGQFDPGLQVLAHPPADLSLLPPGNALNGTLQASFIGKNTDPARPFLLLGQAGGSRIEATEVQLRFGLSAKMAGGAPAARGSFLAEALITGGKVVLDASSADGFLAAFLPDQPIETALDIGASWTPTDGLRLKGSTGLEISVPVNRSLGPLEFQRLLLSSRLDTDSGSIPLEISSTLSGQLGPLTVTVDRLGIKRSSSFRMAKETLGRSMSASATSPRTAWALRSMRRPLSAAAFCASIRRRPNTAACWISRLRRRSQSKGSGC